MWPFYPQWKHSASEYQLFSHSVCRWSWEPHLKQKPPLACGHSPSRCYLDPHFRHRFWCRFLFLRQLSLPSFRASFLSMRLCLSISLCSMTLLGSTVCVSGSSRAFLSFASCQQMRFLLVLLVWNSYVCFSTSSLRILVWMSSRVRCILFTILQLYYINCSTLVMSNGEETKSNLTDRLGAKPGVLDIASRLTGSQNMQILREEQEKKLSSQALSMKRNLETSVLALGAGMVALTTLNFMRGMNPAHHELRHRWSRPVWLLLNGYSLVTLVGTCYFGWNYSTMGEGTEEIRTMAADPRIFLDVDKVYKDPQSQGQFIVEKHSLREKLQS